MMRKANMFLQNTIKEAKIKCRKAFAVSNYGKCFKGIYIKYNQDNSCTQKTLLSLDYISIWKAAHKSQYQGARQFSKLISNEF